MEARDEETVELQRRLIPPPSTKRVGGQNKERDKSRYLKDNILKSAALHA